MTENRTLGDFGGDDGEESDETVAGSPEADDAESDSAAGGGATEPPSGDASLDPDEEGAADFDDAAADSDDVTAGPAPVTVTYAWSPEGDACAECGETVDTRWRAGDGADDPDAMVCASCKRW